MFCQFIWKLCSSTSLNSVDLTNSPFLFSEAYNLFMTVTSDSNNNNNNNTIVAMTDMHNKTITRLRDYMSGSGVQQQQECIYAFLVDHQIVNGFSFYFDIHIPAVLEWVLQNTTTDLGLAPYDKNSPCLMLSRVTPSLLEGRCVVKSIQCHCRYPFVGNPYLPNGRVDECSLYPNLPWCKSRKDIIIADGRGIAQKLGLKIKKPRGGKRFSKQISKLIHGGDVIDVQLLGGNPFANIMIIHFNMLGSCMKDRIVGQGNSRHVVTPKSRSCYL
ncbi:unnamed protein product [Camellia sinensis]